MVKSIEVSSDDTKRNNIICDILHNADPVEYNIIILNGKYGNIVQTHNEFEIMTSIPNELSMLGLLAGYKVYLDPELPWMDRHIYYTDSIENYIKEKLNFFS